MGLTIDFFLGGGIGFSIGCVAVIIINLYTQNNKKSYRSKFK